MQVCRSRLNGSAAPGSPHVAKGGVTDPLSRKRRSLSFHRSTSPAHLADSSIYRTMRPFAFIVASMILFEGIAREVAAAPVDTNRVLHTFDFEERQLGN